MAMTPRRAAQDMRDQKDSPERTEPTAANEPMESTEPADPTLPTESTDPTEPIESTEPREAMHRNESRDHSDHLALLPAAPGSVMSACAFRSSVTHGTARPGQEPGPSVRSPT